MYKLIDGKAISEQVKLEIAEEVKAIVASGRRAPHLAVIIVGHDGGSETYVAHKVKSCEQVGFKSTKITFEDDVTEAELLAKIDELNKDTGLASLIALSTGRSPSLWVDFMDAKSRSFNGLNCSRSTIGSFISMSSNRLFQQTVAWVGNWFIIKPSK